MTFDGRIRADARSLPIASESVQCVVTSPPYWGLRKYDVDGPQIGCETTPAAWVAEMVTVFREVRRVLRPDGIAWVNIGDSYAGSFCGQGKREGDGFAARSIRRFGTERSITRNPRTFGLKPKDLCLMPQRLAIALQDDGWYVRAEIIWAKGSPMPESVTDRVTRSHEQIWMLSKSRHYFYNAEAIKEPASTNSHARAAKTSSNWDTSTGEGGHGNQHRHGRDSWRGSLFNKGKTAINLIGRQQSEGSRRKRPPGVTPKAADLISGIRNNESFGAAVKDTVELRNKRSVWFVNSVGYPDAHYATFPPALIEPCILAGSRLGDFVLDPFAGSGTTAMVAEKHLRRGISIDLGYQDLQAKRLRSSYSLPKNPTRNRRHDPGLAPSLFGVNS